MCVDTVDMCVVKCVDSTHLTALPHLIVPLAGQLVQHVRVVVKQDVQNVLEIYVDDI